MHQDRLRFEREAEMSASVIRWLQRNNLVVKSEFSLPWGICDFVGVALNPERVQRRLAHGQRRAVSSAVQLHILSRIPPSESGRSVSLTRLEREFSPYLAGDILRREVDSLIHNKFLASLPHGLLHKLDGWGPLHERIVAVETKLTRLSEAAVQAAANRAFATESYVALPGALATSAAADKRKDVFLQKGIGLLGVWHHQCRILIGASSVACIHNEIVQTQVVERFWRARGN